LNEQHLQGDQHLPQDSNLCLPLYRDRNLYALFSTVLILLFAITLITPALPQIAEAFDISPSRLGLLTSVYALPAIFLDPVLGIVADRVGRKRLVITASLIFGAAFTACAFARSFEELLIFRFIQGMGGAGLRSLPLAIAGDLYTGVRRTTAIGYFTAIAGIASLVYSGIGGFLADRSWHYLFLMGIFCLPVAGFIGHSLQVHESRQPAPWRKHIQMALQTLQDPRLVVLYACSALLGALNYGIFMVYFPLLAAETFEVSSLKIGAVLGLSAIAFILASTSVGRLARLRSELFLTQLGFGLCALGLLTIPLMPRFELLVIPVVVFAVGNGIAFPGIRTLLASLASPNYLGTTMSANGSSFGLGLVFGPLLAGFIVGAAGIHSVFFVGTGISFAATLVLANNVRSQWVAKSLR
jgi:ACDE family multidrug resistance protein